ncbi:hypothetical protein SPFM6_00125 [Salmonella phage SPFM6]|nr:hypothetical protein SPFM6_00125 [Salmonella phage SPFM6]
MVWPKGLMPILLGLMVLTMLVRQTITRDLLSEGKAMQYDNDDSA